jgi:hypothetical protein
LEPKKLSACKKILKTKSLITFSGNSIQPTPQISDSQPGCRKEVSGVPPNLELLMFYYMRCCKIVIFNPKMGAANLFKDLRGAANQKRLKNTALDYQKPYCPAINRAAIDDHFFIAPGYYFSINHVVITFDF